LKRRDGKKKRIDRMVRLGLSHGIKASHIAGGDGAGMGADGRA